MYNKFDTMISNKRMISTSALTGPRSVHPNVPSYAMAGPARYL